MQFISSDTSVWIDFSVIGYVHAPFLLKDQFTFMMSGDSIDAEILDPPELRDDLLRYGLQRTEIDEEEYRLALSYKEVYHQLSSYDAIALAIAKKREIVLLTADGLLRKAAFKEKVEVHGTLWVVDELWKMSRVGREDYKGILSELKMQCGKKVRLPLEEVNKRLGDL